MARSLTGFLVLILAISIYHAASIFYPISDSHRSAALEIFKPVDGSFGSLEETYETLRTFEVLGIKADVSEATCGSVPETLGSSSSTPKDLFYALGVNGNRAAIRENEAQIFYSMKGIISRLQAAVNNASSFLDFYYSIGSLRFIKDQTSKTDLYLTDAEGIFHSIKVWHLKLFVELVSLASSEIDQSVIGIVKNDIPKLFGSIEKYDDGAFHFDEKLVSLREQTGPLATSSSIVRGLTAFANVITESLKLPGAKILGLAKFFLGVGIPGNAKDFFNQVDSLACLEDNTVSITLILSFPSTVISLTRKGPLLIKVNTVLGSNAPPLTVKLLRAYSSSAKDSSVIENKELQFDSERAVYFLDVLPESVDVGDYVFVFKVVLYDSEHKSVYTTGTLTQVPIYVMGLIKIDNTEIAVLDSDLGSVETQKKLDLARENDVSLSANHLQKLCLSFQLTTPLGNAFKPHQAFLKLRLEGKVEHIFVVGNTGKKFQIILDFLGLVEKFFYLSDIYYIQLTVGDAAMENSLLQDIGHIELDILEPPEKAPRPSAQSVHPDLRYGPKAEITHIFRAPEKLPSKELSLAFLGLTVLPFIGFSIGLLRLAVNMKNFPTSAGPWTFAILFHIGIATVLFLYVLFCVKLDLFTTLKTLGFLGVFLMFAGHKILSHLVSGSSKLKSSLEE